LDLSTIFGNSTGPNDEERAAIIKFAKQNYPHLVYDSVAIEWDEDHREIKNKDTVSALYGWQKEVMYNLNPKETPIVISHLTNGSGKTHLLTLMLTLLLIDDHPSLSPGFMGIKGEFWLLTNTSLLKTEYPKAFLKNPGFLGSEDVYKNGGLYTISNSRGEKFQIKCNKDNEGTVSSFENITNGKSIKFWSYAVNEQKLAGHNPLSIFCDEFGDKTTTNSASGANRLTWGKFEEMIVRCGRNHSAGNSWVFCLFFTLTLGEAWIEDMIDLAKDNRMIIPDLNKQRNLPDDHQCVHLVKGTATTENPFINKSTIQVALGLGDLLGRGEGLARRLLSTDGDDPNLVFSRERRPKRLTISEAKDIIEKSVHEAGWMFVQSIDPGWRDKCAVLFTLCHPIKGIYVLDEIYASGLTVPKVAAMVKNIEYLKFDNKHVDKRLYDPNHIGKTTQESPVANYKLWKDSGLPGIPARNSRDRAYDRMFELIYRGLINYEASSCPGLDREIRVHRKDANGVPEERQNNHSIDALRYICNWFYEDYAKKIHLAVPKEQAEISPERAFYYQQLEYYNKFVKPMVDEKEDTNNSILGVKLKGISKNSLKGFKRS